MKMIRPLECLDVDLLLREPYIVGQRFNCMLSVKQPGSQTTSENDRIYWTHI